MLSSNSVVSFEQRCKSCKGCGISDAKPCKWALQSRTNTQQSEHTLYCVNETTCQHTHSMHACFPLTHQNTHPELGQIFQTSASQQPVTLTVCLCLSTAAVEMQYHVYNVLLTLCRNYQYKAVFLLFINYNSRCGHDSLNEMKCSHDWLSENMLLKVNKHSVSHSAP